MANRFLPAVIALLVLHLNVGGRKVLASAATSTSTSTSPTTPPSPISWQPSEYWDGDDGSWSSFSLRLGTPQQDVRVLPSTAGQATWVVLPEGCTGDGPSCNQSRGGVFDSMQSSTWNNQGLYELGLELNFGDLYNASADYGLETVALGLTNATGGPTLSGQVVAGIATNDFYIGMFGLGHQGTNFSTLDNPQPTFMSTLKAKNLIPSLSWSYTAGAIYRLKGVFGSLTLGGYDSSRYVSNDVEFFLEDDVSRDLVVGLQSITTSSSNGSSVSLLPTSVLAFIDSTLPFIYLPLEACQAFEEELGLIFNENIGAYTIDDSLHNALVTRNPNITFQLGDSLSSSPSVKIVLPYSSFDLNFSSPAVNSSTRYFPLMRAASKTQYTLGRAFLQEAYISVNYEYSNFSVSQCRFEDGLQPDILPLPPTTTLDRSNSTSNPPSSSSPPASTTASATIPVGVIIGIALGGSAILSISILLTVFVFRRRRTAPQSGEDSPTSDLTKLSDEKDSQEFISVKEIDSTSLSRFKEMDDSGRIELQGFPKVMLELPGSKPVVHELAETSSIIDNMSFTRNLASLRHSARTSVASAGHSVKSWIGLSKLRTTNLNPRLETLNSASTTGTVDLNRSLPPTPISESPQTPWTSISETALPPGRSATDSSEYSFTRTDEQELKFGLNYF